MPYDKALETFFYKVSYKNSTPALPNLLADFTKLFSSIADFWGQSPTELCRIKILHQPLLSYLLILLSSLVLSPILGQLIEEKIMIKAFY